jgi:pantoate--beta-alanine ligase
MIKVKTIAEVRKIIKQEKNQGKTIGLFATLGYLHEGHLKLIGICRQNSDYCVMSLFVNKMQFNDKNDFEKYPREFDRDLKLAEEAGVDLVFMPDDNEMYDNRLTYVDIDSLADNLCGARRIGHFRGVLTVVSKIFNIIQPDITVFGQKDIQQAVCIEKMVFDLNFQVKILICPIIREENGLAMSSRNKHLSPQNKINALSIYKSLQKAEKLILSGETDCSIIIKNMKKIVKQGRPEKIDYISAVSYSDLQPVKKITDKTVIAVAAYFGKTRLIDNMIIEKNTKGFQCVY